MCSPIENSTPLFCHHVHLRITGSTNAFAGVVAALDPLDPGAGGEDGRRGHRRDAELGAVHRQALADRG